MKCAAIALIILPSALCAQEAGDLGAVADRVFAQWNDHTPGCAVGVSRHGAPILERGYGMADLETGARITPETIFESGSVAKQFTATAALFLAADGKLSLDDPVRKYLPELPDYGRPLTIRHLLTHTSGLREWSNLVAMAGWPRGTRVHTQNELLDAVFAQKSLNYPVGDYYSYTNSGFALLEAIVERVSGEPFARFSNERIFRPLGLTHTAWRDDFTTVVPGRAQAYARRGNDWRLDMPFENVIGPGGLLTTVGDWLRWNDALDRKTLGANVVDSLEKRATLTSGRRIQYGMGLFITSYRGVAEISHSGSTAGYSTFLARYPGHDLSVAVLCNVAGAPATSFTHQLVDALLPDLALAERPDTVATPPSALNAVSGVYRSTRTHEPLYLGVSPAAGGGGGGRGANNGGRGGRGAPLRALRSGGYLLGANRILVDTLNGGKPRGLRMLLADGDTVQYEFAAKAAWAPTAAELATFAGRYHSDEVGATYAARVEDDHLVLALRTGVQSQLAPAYPGAFSAPGIGTVWFTRDRRGRVSEMHVGAARLWDLVFQRVP